MVYLMTILHVNWPNYKMIEESNLNGMIYSWTIEEWVFLFKCTIDPSHILSKTI